MEQTEENVPETMLWVVLQRQRNSALFIKLILYCVFVAVFITVTQLLRPVRATFTVQDTLLEHTVRTHFPQAQWAKTFYDISTDAEWWEWVETVLLPSIMTNHYFNGDPRYSQYGSRF